MDCFKTKDNESGRNIQKVQKLMLLDVTRKRSRGSGNWRRMDSIKQVLPPEKGLSGDGMQNWDGVHL